MDGSPQWSHIIADDEPYESARKQPYDCASIMMEGLNGVTSLSEDWGSTYVDLDDSDKSDQTMTTNKKRWHMNAKLWERWQNKKGYKKTN